MPSPFWMLCELSNVDKHRTIHVINHYPATPELFLDPIIVGAHIETLDVDDLKDGTVLARITVPRPIGVAHEMNLRSRTKNGVAIAHTDKTPRAHLGMAVDSVRDAVEKATKRLRRHLP
jgi:hypothetical protein